MKLLLVAILCLLPLSAVATPDSDRIEAAHLIASARASLRQIIAESDAKQREIDDQHGQLVQSAKDNSILKTQLIQESQESKKSADSAHLAWKLLIGTWVVVGLGVAAKIYFF